MCTSRRPGKKTIRQVIYNQGTPAPGTYNQTKKTIRQLRNQKKKTKNQNLQGQKSEKGKQEIRIFKIRNQKKNKKSESLGVQIRKRKTRNQNVQDQKSEKNEKSVFFELRTQI